MKIAVISDIHANLHALTAVINDFEKRGVDRVFALGDYVMAGPQPVETMKFVITQPWVMIQGNTDKLITDYSEKTYNDVKASFPVMGEALKYDISVLPQKYKDFLKSLPPEKIIEIDGVKIHLVHGSPRRNNENIYPDLREETVEEMTASSDADLILCGHTHIPCGYQLNNKKTVVNAGSVGRSMTPDAMPCYAILEIENGQFTVEHHFVNYERELAADIIRSHGFDGADKLADMLFDTTSRHI